METEEQSRNNSLLFKGVEDRKEHFRKIGYSACYFAFSWIILAYTAHAWSTSNAWDIGLHPLFSYDGMEQLSNTVGWNLNRIAWVYLAPPLWGLLVSFFALITFSTIEGKHVHLRTLLFWFAFNGYLLYFSYVLMGLLSGQDYSSRLFNGFVAFYSWLLWSKEKIYGILIFQAIASLPFALLFSKGVLQLNYSRILASKSNGKPIVFLNVFLAPAMLGFALIILATFPMDAQYQSIRMACFIPLATIALLGLALHKAKHIQIVKGGLKPVPLIGLMVLALAILASRLILSIHVEPFW